MKRHTVILFVAILIAILIGGWLYLMHGNPSVSSSGALAPTVILSGQHSGAIMERKNYRIENQEDFEALVSMIYGNDAPPPLPPIDFANEEVLAVFDGTHTTGGYGIKIASIVDDGSARHITVMHAAHEDSCVESQALTSPFEVVVVPKSPLSLDRKDATETLSCD